MNERQSRILVVEDTEANIDVIVDTLGSEYELSIAIDGESALEMVEEINPDLILLDIMMPGIDGYEVCQRLKAEVATQDIPVIFLTALSDNADETKGLHLGAVDYISKPFIPDIMKSRVMIHLELSRSRMILQEQHDRIDDDFQRLRELEKLRDDLVNMIVHDMRSPVMGICGRLEVAREILQKQHAPEDVLEDIESALQSAFTLSSMVCSLLDINSFESGKMPIKLEQTDLVLAAQSVIDSIGEPSRNCKIQLNPLEDHIDAMCDPSMVKKTLKNLINNALSYSPPSGAVNIEIAREEEWFRISVSDNGPGIPPEYRDSIFQKFAHLDDESSLESSGLGLTYCKLAVDAHGGSIQLESSSEIGTTFHVRLPVAQTASPMLAGADRSDKSETLDLSGEPTVLVIDDSRTVTDALKRYFDQHSDWKTVTLNQPERAVRVARRIHPDLILIDINMPGEMGSEVAEKLEEYPDLKGTQMVYHTELISPEEVNLETLQNYGKYPVIPKGIPLAHIATLIFELLLQGTATRDY